MHVSHQPRSIPSHRLLLFYLPPSALPPTTNTTHPPAPGYGPQLWQASVLSLTLFIALNSINFISMILIAGQDARSNMVPVCLGFSMCKCVCQSGLARVFSVCCCRQESVDLAVCAPVFVCNKKICVCQNVCSEVSSSAAAVVLVLCLLCFCLYDCLLLPLFCCPSPSLSPCRPLALSLSLPVRSTDSLSPPLNTKINEK